MIPISGVQSFSTVDYPGLHSCVLFAQGCPWRCRYCHNTELQKFDSVHLLNQWNLFEGFLQRRRMLLDAVVFSGGEVTAHSNLKAAMSRVKELGFKVGLHTAGVYPTRFKEVLECVDWVGFDVKAPFDERYEKVTGIKNSHKIARESLDYLLDSKVAFQLRCTVHPLLLSENDVDSVRKQLRGLRGDLVLHIQNFNKRGCKDTELVA